MESNPTMLVTIAPKTTSLSMRQTAMRAFFKSFASVSCFRNATFNARRKSSARPDKKSSGKANMSIPAKLNASQMLVNVPPEPLTCKAIPKTSSIIATIDTTTVFFLTTNRTTSGTAATAIKTAFSKIVSILTSQRMAVTILHYVL